MKNMYLAAAMVVSLAFSACSDEESGKADRAYKPIEIYGNINEVVNNVQETRAVGAAWGSDDRIEKGLIAVDSQGYLREVRDTHVYPVDWTEKRMRIMRPLMQWIPILISNIAMKPEVRSVL